MLHSYLGSRENSGTRCDARFINKLATLRWGLLLIELRSCTSARNNDWLSPLFFVVKLNSSQTARDPGIGRRRR